MEENEVQTGDFNRNVYDDTMGRPYLRYLLVIITFTLVLKYYAEKWLHKQVCHGRTFTLYLNGSDAIFRPLDLSQETGNEVEHVVTGSY